MKGAVAKPRTRTVAGQNLVAGKCCTCGTFVPAGCGTARRVTSAGAWLLQCMAHSASDSPLIGALEGPPECSAATLHAAAMLVVATGNGGTQTSRELLALCAWRCGVSVADALAAASDTPPLVAEPEAEREPAAVVDLPRRSPVIVAHDEAGAIYRDAAGMLLGYVDVAGIGRVELHDEAAWFMSGRIAERFAGGTEALWYPLALALDARGRQNLQHVLATWEAIEGPRAEGAPPVFVPRPIRTVDAPAKGRAKRAKPAPTPDAACSSTPAKKTRTRRKAQPA